MYASTVTYTACSIIKAKENYNINLSINKQDETLKLYEFFATRFPFIFGIHTSIVNS